MKAVANGKALYKTTLQKMFFKDEVHIRSFHRCIARSKNIET